MRSYGSVVPTALQRTRSAITVLADDDASPPLSPLPMAGAADDTDYDEATPLVPPPTKHMPLPGGLASLWSSLFFSWCEYLATVSAKRPLRLDDIWPLDKNSKSLVCAQYFQAKVDKLHCVVRAFHVTQAGMLISSGLLTLASVACELATPIAVFEVVRSASNHEFESIYSRGTLWTGALLLARFLRSFLLGWADFLLNYALVRTTGPLNILLLESVLSGKGDRHVSNADDVTNLFATDTTTVAGIIRVFHRTWSTPLLLVGLCVIFNKIVGAAASSLFIVCPLIYLIIQLLNIRETWLLREWMRLSDRRFAELYSMFDQILGVKLNVWQDRVLATIEAVRRDEKRVLQRHTLVRTIRMSLTWAAPSLNLIATGVILAYTPNKVLTTPAQTFAAVTIFHAINDAFTELITVMRNALEFRMAMGRIQSVVPVARHVPTHLPFDFLTRSCQTHPCLPLPLPTDETLETPVATETHDAIVFTNASFTHPLRADSDPLLDYISLRVRRGEFIVVHGRVGSGKSILLAAMAGLMQKKRGHATVAGSIAYCTQAPWIQSTTVRDNILFGRTYDAERYWNVLSACELLPDIHALPRGDQTPVGSRSYVNLSSGQQSRIALARACYADADLYILDSPLDSVDSIVQCEILLKCMGRLLQHKTIVLASHNPEVIMSEYVDRTIEMDGMEIVTPSSETDERSFGRCRSSSGVSSKKPFESRRSRLLAECDSMGRQRRSSSMASTTRPAGLVLDPSVCLDPHVLEIQAIKAPLQPPPTLKAASSPSQSFLSNTASSSGYARRPSASVVSVQGSNNMGTRTRHDCKSVIREYLSHSRSPYRLVLVALLHFVTQVLATASIYSFSRWMSQYSVFRLKHNLSNDDAFAASMGAFHVYVALVVASAVSFFVAGYATFAFARGVSDRLFHAMTTSLLQARMSFFAETTVGKLLNRYCRDLQAVDSTLHDCVFALLKTFFGCYCALFASLGWMSGHILKSSNEPNDMETIGLEPGTSLTVWLGITVFNFALASVIVTTVWFIGIRSSRPSSELFLMLREALSPIFTYVSESIAGKSVIRAFGPDQRERVTERFAELLDRVTRISWAIWCFESWLTMRSILIENVVTGTLLIGLICFGHDADASRPATIGLLLLLLLNLRDDLKNVFVHWNALQRDVVCLQRVFEYVHLAPEVPANPELPLALVDPILWPRSGALSFAHVDFQYSQYIVPGQYTPASEAEVLEPHMTLRDVSFQVQRGERVGIIGRSGAGKSSLAMALLRVNNPTRGVITLDGVDITRVELNVLRKKIEYLPPNPVFFSGTVREYLDPFFAAAVEDDEYALVSDSSLDDFELWSVLDKTGLKASIRRVPQQLDASLENVVDAWSSGERQLLCLARALLLRARVIFLDEATTSTDQATDFSVQRVVCQSLDPDMTLLCISHRIDAVLKFDKLLVMSHGRIEGFGTADELIASGDGEFFELLENAQLTAQRNARDPVAKWIEFLDANGDRLGVHYVAVRDEDVDGLTTATYAALIGVYDVSRIFYVYFLVFPNRAAFDTSDSLKEGDASVGGMGESIEDPLVVQLSPCLVVGSTGSRYRLQLLEQATEVTTECRLRTWTTGVAHAISHIHAFMKPLGGCTELGQVYWREEERQIASILLDDWTKRHGKKRIVMGSPGVGKSVMLRLVALYLALVERANVLVAQYMGWGCCCLYFIGHCSHRVVWFSKGEDWTEAMAIYYAFRASFSSGLLLLDGFQYSDLPDDYKTSFDLLMTYVPAETDDARAASSTLCGRMPNQSGRTSHGASAAGSHTTGSDSVRPPRWIPSRRRRVSESVSHGQVTMLSK